MKLLPSRGVITLPSGELWSLLGYFAGIGRVERALTASIGRVLLPVVSRVGAGSVKALRGPVTGYAGWRDCWNQLDWGRIRFVGNDLVFVPLVSFTGRAPFGDVLTLPVRLRPPEMRIAVVIGVVCRYWEGDFACGR